jgi:hypothetical protein
MNVVTESIYFGILFKKTNVDTVHPPQFNSNLIVKISKTLSIRYFSSKFEEHDALLLVRFHFAEDRN